MSVWVSDFVGIRLVLASVRQFVNLCQGMSVCLGDREPVYICECVSFDCDRLCVSLHSFSGFVNVCQCVRFSVFRWCKYQF